MRTLKVRKLAFSLTELVIVAVIIGFIAAIVIPRISTGSEEAKLAALKANLTVIRNQIDIYAAQHEGRTPNLDGAWNSSGAGGLFIIRMTNKTNADAGVDANGRFGPYFNRFPVNPFNGKSDLRIDGAPAGQGVFFGWHFDTSTGRFSADDSPEHAAL
ncbi:MAG: type II secretion system protein [Planctomycetota bacterium]